jgi:hypothetical protein
MTWEQYRAKLTEAGYRYDGPGAYRHKTTGRVIKPYTFQRQLDGVRRLNWEYWAANDFVPPPF